MKKFTKSLLVLALLVLAVGGAKAGVQTVVKSFDYTTNPVKQDGADYYTTGYPFYFDAGWISASSTAPTLNAGSLELKNATTDSYQALILDWATVKKGYGYKAKITYKSTAAGDVNFTFGTWSNTLNKDGVAIEATDDWKTLCVDLGTANFGASASAHFFWKFSFEGTINIKKVEIIEVAPDLVYLTEEEKYEAPAGTTDLKDLTGTNTSWSVTYPKELTGGTEFCGDGNGSTEGTHVTITGKDYICFVVTGANGDGQQLRVWIWDGTAGGAGTVKTLYAYPIANYEDATWETPYSIKETGTYVVKVTGYNYLKGVKTNYGGGSITISQAYISSGEAPVAYSSTGKTTIYGTEYLNDPTITCIDATALITDGQTLNPANPNALFIAKAGKLINTNNVIVDGTCATLALTDGNYPFKAYDTFTATNVSYNREFKAGKKSTVCLPFALTPAEAAAAGTFYELSGVNAGNTEFTFTDVTASGTTAYKPYVFEAKANGTPFTGYSSKPIPVTPASLIFTGEKVEGYTLTGVLAGSSDVAADFEGKTVYGWSGNDGKEGDFVKVGTGVAINPFRAYVVYDGDGVSLARMAARFVSGSVTGINEVSETQNVLNPDRKYIENNNIVIVKNGVKFNAAGQLLK